jgi:hypothetical protein
MFYFSLNADTLCLFVRPDSNLGLYKVATLNIPAVHDVWTAVQKRCIGHLCLYGEMGFLNIHKSKNIRRG